MSGILDALTGKQAFDDSKRSGLPGHTNGPRDAFRHVLGAAELTRRHGETVARAVLEANEQIGDIRGQKPEENAMDRHNNEIGIAIGREAKTYDEIVERAREKIDAAARGAEGDNVPRWLPEEKWKGGGANWPPDWNQITRRPEDEPYEYGGEEYRYPGWKDESAPEDTNELLGQPVETWSEEDVLALQSSEAYRTPWDPMFAETQARVAGWYRHFYGDGPALRDATGRMRDDLRPIRPIPPGRGGPVHVRAHSRAGGAVSVHAYERSRPWS